VTRKADDEVNGQLTSALARLREAGAAMFVQREAILALLQAHADRGGRRAMLYGVPDALGSAIEAELVAVHAFASQIGAVIGKMTR